MGQKVNPQSIRVGIIRTWDSMWYSEKEFVNYLKEDFTIRKFLKKEYSRAFIARIEIARFPQLVNVTVSCAKPGILIGRKGAEIEELNKKLEKLVPNKKINLSVKEIKVPELDASVAGQDIARQIERRISYKRAIRQSIRNSIKAGAKGIKIRISGRLNGAEIARTEEFKEGRIPLSTLSADIDYCMSQSYTEMGVIGIKVWICR
ncbi:MAG: 30S ribosomal protein S3 [Brevinematales bacterium]|nr:30S ribosomal protein S3 [Brevinematales bacterium]